MATTKLQKAEEAENQAGSDEDEGKLPCNMSLKRDFLLVTVDLPDGYDMRHKIV